ncbi:ribosomal protein S5 domain 2-type protein [Scheffersomyces coipomensis]|uniref:ribosomal protein S5 domain 2-type protein n=1 Tax=Scheffersomyces coipomensis TaxID=1788519 RepID=UPI00315D71B9
MSFTVKTSLLENSDGSAQLITGDIKLIASVSGPIEPKPRQELPNVASLEIVIRPAVGLSGTREKALEDKLRSLLQAVIVRYKYPRQLIQVVIQFLSTPLTKYQGGAYSNHKDEVEYSNIELNAAINGCYFALVDAGIALYSSFASVCISLTEDHQTIDEEPEYIIDPNLKQLHKSDSHHVICFNIEDKKANKILLLESLGDFTEEQLFTVISKAVTQCELIHNDYQRKYITEKIDNDYVWKA